jgi:hypothetical protein
LLTPNEQDTLILSQFGFAVRVTQERATQGKAPKESSGTVDITRPEKNIMRNRPSFLSRLLHQGTGEIYSECGSSL